MEGLFRRKSHCHYFAVEGQDEAEMTRWAESLGRKVQDFFEGKRVSVTGCSFAGIGRMQVFEEKWRIGENMVIDGASA